MQCPYCGANLTSGQKSPCPRCGKPLPEAEAGVVRTSAVRVSAAEVDRVYRSVSEVPPELRQRLKRAIHGPNSDTFVIADERGREQLFQIISGLPGPLQRRVLAALRLADSKRRALSPGVRAGLIMTGLTTLLTILWLIWRW